MPVENSFVFAMLPGSVVPSFSVKSSNILPLVLRF